MTLSSHLAPLLSQWPIVVWVEDRLTRAYLQDIWQADNALIQILVAGGNETVAGVVHDLRGLGYANVFGFADRDFRSTNRDRWLILNSGIEVFRPQALEIENFLLDWDALAGCTENQSRQLRSSGELRRQAETLAQSMVWWMACRRILSHVRELLINAYPQHPRQDRVTTLEEALDYITTPGWYSELPNHSRDIQNRNFLESKLTEAHGELQGFLSNGGWVREFSGKEIFRKVRGYMFNARYGNDETMDIDLAKSVARWQVANSRQPQELTELLSALKLRAGIQSA